MIDRGEGERMERRLKAEEVNCWMGGDEVVVGGLLWRRWTGGLNGSTVVIAS